MQTLELENERVADLHWLAFLITGHREQSVDLAIEAAVSEARNSQDGTGPFFSAWMLAWSRRVVIAKALAAIRGELNLSARRMESERARKSALPPRGWVAGQEATKVQLERALLAIEVFPRCAVVLSIFEGMPLEDAAILLDADQDLVRKARRIGLHELTRNLAEMQGWTSDAGRSYVMTIEMQHA
jgi:DNA-directed RNA polymerase specialized sigma24 family protein